MTKVKPIYEEEYQGIPCYQCDNGKTHPNGFFECICPDRKKGYCDCEPARKMRAQDKEDCKINIEQSDRAQYLVKLLSDPDRLIDALTAMKNALIALQAGIDCLLEGADE